MEPEFAPLPPTEAIAFLQQKGYKTSFAWEDVWQEEHAKAFTVAKMMRRDLLEDTKNALDDALREGKTFEQFRKELAPKLQAKGWWGKQEMADPKTGEIKKVQLGSNRRLRTIFDTNLRTSKAHGQWARIERTKAAFPYLLYDAVNDNITRPEHRAWDGVCLPVDDPWWQTHSTPCDWGCRCRMIQINESMAKNRGIKLNERPPSFPNAIYKNPRTGELISVEKGIGPGFNYNIGKAPLRGLSPRPLKGKPIKPKKLNEVKSAITAFLNVFGANKKAKIIKDKQNWPIVISNALFIDMAGEITIPDLDNFKSLPLIAEALKNYDSVEFIWETAKDKKSILIRRYKKRLDIGLITIDFTKDYWTYNIQ